MDFIDEQNCLLAHLAVQLRFIHDFFDFLNPAGHRTEIHEMRLRALSDDPGQRRFAHARRPPENHRGHLILFDQLPQDLSLA